MRTPDRSVAAVNPKPQDSELDVFGLSHAGNVRAENQDHFLLATVHKRVHIRLTNLTQQQRLPVEDERLAVFAMVADGVGGGESAGKSWGRGGAIRDSRQEGTESGRLLAGGREADARARAKGEALDAGEDDCETVVQGGRLRRGLTAALVGNSADRALRRRL